MSKTIWKWRLMLISTQIVLISPIHELLTVKMYDGVPCLWAIVDPEKIPVQVNIHAYSTGESAPENIGPEFAQYLGTIQRRGEVWHFFSE